MGSAAPPFRSTASTGMAMKGGPPGRVGPAGDSSPPGPGSLGNQRFRPDGDEGCARIFNVPSGPWSDIEIEMTIDVYFQMLTLELAGETYTKTEFRREVER